MKQHKKTIILVVIHIVVFLSALMAGLNIAHAGGQVYVTPLIKSSHGQNLNAKDLYTKITYPQGSQSQNLVPTYDLTSFPGQVEYSVTGVPTDYYTFTLSEDCSGTVDDGELKKCVITWVDDGDKLPPPAPVFTPEFGLGGPVVVTLAPETVESVDSVLIAELEQKIALLLQLIDLINQLIILQERANIN